MKARLLVASIVFVFFVALFGCEGEKGAEGPQGPAGGQGGTQPIKVLVTAPDVPSDDVARGMIAAGVFPTGTVAEAYTIVYIVDIPSLREYDAVLFWRGGDLTAAEGDSLGDLLADYVDSGGGLVISQGALSSEFFALGGRIMTDAYSPLKLATASGVAGPRTVDVSSLSQPVHPIFHGTDFLNVSLNISSMFSNPPLTTGATLLAVDNVGHNLVAVNTAENVVGINLWPWGELGSVPALQLIANCVLHVAGKI